MIENLRFHHIGIAAHSIDKCIKSMPDGKGTMKKYECQELFRLLISETEIQKLLKLLNLGNYL